MDEEVDLLSLTVKLVSAMPEVLCHTAAVWASTSVLTGTVHAGMWQS